MTIFDLVDWPTRILRHQVPCSRVSILQSPNPQTHLCGPFCDDDTLTIPFRMSRRLFRFTALNRLRNQQNPSLTMKGPSSNLILFSLLVPRATINYSAVVDVRNSFRRPPLPHTEHTYVLHSILFYFISRVGFFWVNGVRLIKKDTRGPECV